MFPFAFPLRLVVQLSWGWWLDHLLSLGAFGFLWLMCVLAP